MIGVDQMGVTKLLSITNIEEINIRELVKVLKIDLNLERRPVMAIDTYVLMHRYAFYDAEFLLTNPKNRPIRMINAIMQHLAYLREVGFDCCLVFDGKYMAMKSRTEKIRARNRENALIKGNWEQALAITPLYAHYLMLELDKLNIPYIVAPFEADPQLVYLEKTGKADVIYTIDSDVIVYGCKRAILAEKNGYVKYYKAMLDDRIVRICKADSEDEDFIDNEADDDNGVKTDDDGYKYFDFCSCWNGAVPTISGMSLIQVQLLAVILGCDYFKGIYGLGPRKAIPIVNKARAYFKKECPNGFILDLEKTVRMLLQNENMLLGLQKMVQKTLDLQPESLTPETSVHIRKRAKPVVHEIVHNMVDAFYTFREQPVYDPDIKRVVRFSGVDLLDSDKKLFGDIFDDKVQTEIAEGKRDPNTGEIFN